jgi:hypothetical protein
VYRLWLYGGTVIQLALAAGHRDIENLSAVGIDTKASLNVV